MKNNLSYYPRRVDWHRNGKIKLLKVTYGLVGDSNFGTLCDYIGEADGCWLDLSKPFVKANVAEDLKMTLDELDSFIAFLAGPCELLIKKSGCVSTNTAQETLVQVNKEREDARLRYNKKRDKHEKVKTSDEDLKSSPVSSTKKDRKEMKGDESELNERKLNESEGFTHGEEVFQKRYYVGADPVEDLKKYFETKFQITTNDLKCQYGEGLYNQLLEKFSAANVQKNWKDDQDLRSHFTSYLRIQQEKINKSQKTGNNKVGKAQKAMEQDAIMKQLNNSSYE